MKNTAYSREDFWTYAPQEINGKTLKISVVEFGEIILTAGMDIETGITYMLKEEFKEEDDLNE